jgi:Tfp pilus assembly protein FimT
VELIVVILIMAILTGTAIISASVIHEGNVSAAAESLVSILANARKTAIAKEADTVVLSLELDADGKYYTRLYYDDDNDGDVTTPSVLLDERKICSDSIAIIIENDDEGLTETPMTTGSKVEFHFLKSNGSLTDGYKGIRLDGSTSKEIVIIRETGRCVLNEAS